MLARQARQQAAPPGNQQRDKACIVPRGSSWRCTMKKRTPYIGQWMPPCTVPLGTTYHCCWHVLPVGASLLKRQRSSLKPCRFHGRVLAIAGRQPCRLLVSADIPMGTPHQHGTAERPQRNVDLARCRCSVVFYPNSYGNAQSISRGHACCAGICGAASLHVHPGFQRTAW